MFGSINALFSGLAFSGVIIAIFLQSQELELQREELKATRHEFELQNETLKLQRFENTFFQMLNLHHEIVSAMVIQKNEKLQDSDHLPAKKGGGFFYTQGTTHPLEEKESYRTEIVELKGRRCMQTFLYDFEIRLKNKSFSPSKKETYLEELGNYLTCYYETYKRYEQHLGHYFRNLYNIIKYIDNSEIENKKVYSSLIRAQLSEFELQLLALNCISSHGQDKFKPLLEKYALLSNLAEKSPIIINSYHQSAFA